LIDLKALEKRISKLEAAINPLAMEGSMPNGETKFFEWKKILKLQYEAMRIKIMCNRTPTLDDFSQEDQNFMKDFVRATLPKDPMMPAVRKTFWMVEKGDTAIYELPLEDFVGPMS
jgi:hypothetical protein